MGELLDGAKGTFVNVLALAGSVLEFREITTNTLMNWASK